MFEYEIKFAETQAEIARSHAILVDGERTRADWLNLARMWDRAAVEYSEMERLRDSVM